MHSATIYKGPGRHTRPRPLFSFHTTGDKVMSDTNIIDKRSLPGQSTINRDRFKKRFHDQIKKSIDDSTKDGSVTDPKADGQDIHIKGTSEPRPRNAPGGITKRVYPGNKKGNDGFIKGDKIARPEGGGGSGGGAGIGDDEEDDFIFHVDRKEWLDYLLFDMELPNLVKQHLAKDSSVLRRVNAGITNNGPPPRLSISRTYRQAFPRQRVFQRKEKIALLASLKEELKKLLEEQEETRDKERIAELGKEIKALNRKLKAIPFFDPSLDMRYHTSKVEPAPIAQAVMFYIMDVSGSVSDAQKDLAFRFFYLLYLFIKRNYKRTEVVFLSHTTEAMEVSEEDFFHVRRSGGTLVSSALDLMKTIVKERYNPLEWNIYVAQASDGDNWESDNDKCQEYLNDILPLVQYFAFIQTLDIGYSENTSLWRMYKKVYIANQFPGVFEMKTVRQRGEIYPVFRELFKKKGVVK